MNDPDITVKTSFVLFLQENDKEINNRNLKNREIRNSLFLLFILYLLILLLSIMEKFSLNNEG